MNARTSQAAGYVLLLAVALLTAAFIGAILSGLDMLGEALR